MANQPTKRNIWMWSVDWKLLFRIDIFYQYELDQFAALVIRHSIFTRSNHVCRAVVIWIHFMCGCSWAHVQSDRRRKKNTTVNYNHHYITIKVKWSYVFVPIIDFFIHLLLLFQRINSISILLDGLHSAFTVRISLDRMKRIVALAYAFWMIEYCYIIRSHLFMSWLLPMNCRSLRFK